MKISTLNTRLRAQFSALAADSSRPVCYFDNAATAFMPQQVREAICSFYDRAHGNVHRAIYTSAEDTTSLYEQVRTQVQSFINANSSQEIIFTSGATDSLNAIAHTWAQHNMVAGDTVVITQAEHHAHYVLWQEMAKRFNFKVHVLPINPVTYTVDLEGLNEVLVGSVKLIAVSTSSNVLGPIWGDNNEVLHQLIAGARSVGACVALDAAQTVAHEPVDVQALDCDFLAFSVHKMGGPTGLGVLYARKQMHKDMHPYRFGGGMVAAVAQGCATWQEAPQQFEAGTPPLAQVVGLGALLDFYRQQVDFDALKKHETFLVSQLIAGLRTIEGVHIVGNQALLNEVGHVVTWYVDDIHAHDLAASLSDRGCAVRAGDHCAQPLAELWDNKATVRASMFMYNSLDEVVLLIEAVRASVARWREVL